MQEQKAFYEIPHSIRSITSRIINDRSFAIRGIRLQKNNQKIIVTDSGELFLSNFPYKVNTVNSYRSIVGIGNVDPLLLQKIPIAEKILSVSGVGNRMMILAEKENGESIVYGMGSNENYLLGTRSQYAFEPEINSIAPGNVKAISMNDYGTFYIINTGELYYNGLIANNTINTNNNPLASGNILVTFPVTGKVTSIFQTDNATAVIIEPGLLFLKGYNHIGQLGTGNCKSVENFTRLITNDLIKFVTMSRDTTAFITEGGKLFLIGDVYNGVREYKPLPLHIPLNEKVVYVSLGESHIAIISVSGKLYTFGSNKDGELGLGDRERRYVPTLVDLPFKTKDVVLVDYNHATSTSTSTVIVNEYGLLYSTDCVSFPNLGRSLLLSSSSSSSSSSNLNYKDRFNLTEDRFGDEDEGYDV